jgi:hypothetical protein
MYSQLGYLLHALFSFQTLAFRSVTRNCHPQFLDPYLETPGRYSPHSRLRADKLKKRFFFYNAMTIIRKTAMNNGPTFPNTFTL